MYYYPHHINDVLARTSTFTDRQTLGYLRLMWEYLGSESSLPDDMEKLSNIANIPEKDVMVILKRRFQLHDSLWIEPDLENMLHEYRTHKDKSKEGGIKSGEVRRMKANRHGGPFGGPPTHNEGDLKGTSRVLEGVFKGTSRVLQPPLNQPITNS